MELKICSRCEGLWPEKMLTVCIHYDTEEVLGEMCPHCVKDWLEYLDTLPLEEQE